MRVHLTRLAASRPSCADAMLRACTPVLYSGNGTGDASKCPFFGGPNGGGIGDANLVTAAVFLLTIVAMNRLFIICATLRPQSVAGSFLTMASRTKQVLSSLLACCRLAPAAT